LYSSLLRLSHEQHIHSPIHRFWVQKIFGGDPAPSGGALGSRQEASKPHLIDFLNSLLPPDARIKDLSFQNLEQLPRSEDDRKAVYDIYCRGENGEYFIVELQKVKQFNFKDHTLYYSTFPIQRQAQKGDWDYRLQAVYCVGVLGFTFDDDQAGNTEVVHTVKLKDQNNQVFFDKLTFIYLEMPNFNTSLELLNSRLDKWLYFLKHLEDLQSIPELLKGDVFFSAFETAKLANLETDERDAYEYSLKTIRDNYSALKSAHQEGLLEGEAKGEQKAKLEIAKNLKAAGMTTAQIQAVTGLSAEELESL
jgi:predicted transposase/invertase (TIGR01784 family)